MVAKVVEAQLRLTGDDKGLTQTLANVSKAFKQVEEASRVTKPLQDVARTLQQVEKASAAVNAAVGAKNAMAPMEAGLRQAREAATATAKALDVARVAAKQFEGVKAARGSEIAVQMKAAANAVREAERAYTSAEREVRKTTSAVAAQASVLRSAEQAARAAGVPIHDLERQQRTLAASVDHATEAVRRQMRTDEQAAKHAAARQQRVEAWKGAAGIVGLSAVHRAEHFGAETIHTYREFDKERRFAKVVMGLSDEQQKPLVDQAIRLGATTKYNDVKVLEAQRELSARGLKADQVLGMIDAATKLGMSLNIPLEQAVQQMEGTIFGFKRDISTVEAARTSAARTADLQVKAAKISGMKPEDLMLAYKTGSTPARMAGVSEETLLAFAGISKKANMGGDESGIAFRALIAAALKPTAGAKTAMLANGLDYRNYQAAPTALNLDGFVRNVASSYGVKLDASARKGLGRIFSDKGMLADPSKFTPAVMAVLEETLGGDDAKSKKSIAGLANRFRDASVGKVDVNRLITDLMTKIPGNLALANAVFGSKQGGRISAALGDPETFKHMIEELVKHSAGFADKVAQERMAGFDGAVSRFEGSVKNLQTKIGRAWDNDGNGGFLTGVTDRAAHLVQSMAEMDNRFVQLGTVVAAAGSAFVGVKSLGLLSSGFGLKGSAAALDSSALALTRAAAALSGRPNLPGGSDRPGAPGKGGGAGVMGTLANALGLYTLAEAAQKEGILLPPDFKKGILKGVLGALDPNLVGPDSITDDRESKIGRERVRAAALARNPEIVASPLIGNSLEQAGAGMEARRNGALLDDRESRIGREMMRRDAAQAGVEAGKAAGDATAQGFKQGPFTEAGVAAGQAVVRGVMSVLSTLQSGGGIASGISFSPGGGGGLGGMIQRASWGGGTLAVGSGAGVGHTASQSERAAYIRARATALGMDPATALRVAQSEGFYTYTGDHGQSFGDWQLYTGGGLGNKALAAGINIRDPNTWRAQTDFALRYAKQHGWTDWHGAARVGIGKWRGINPGQPGSGVMPEESRRPTMPEQTLPDPNSGRPSLIHQASAGGFDRVAERMERAAERIENAQTRSHHTLEVHASPELKVRTKRMRVHGSGAMKPSVGVSMPGARVDGIDV